MTNRSKNYNPAAIGKLLVDALCLPEMTTRIEFVVTPEEATVTATYLPSVDSVEAITQVFDMVPRVQEG